MKAKLSQKSFCCLSVFFSGALEVLHIRRNGFLESRFLLEAECRDLSLESVAKSAIRGCEGTLHYLKESRNCVVQLGVVAVEVLCVNREKPCASTKETVVEFFV